MYKGKGLSQEKIIEIMQTCIPLASISNLESYFDGVKWENWLMSELYVKGCG